MALSLVSRKNDGGARLVSPRPAQDAPTPVPAGGLGRPVEGPLSDGVPVCCFEAAALPW